VKKLMQHNCMECKHTFNSYQLEDSCPKCGNENLWVQTIDDTKLIGKLHVVQSPAYRNVEARRAAMEGVKELSLQRINPAPSIRMAIRKV
jgi:predicted  nucleic acid-binding Zn-ribbon protein